MKEFYKYALAIKYSTNAPQNNHKVLYMCRSIKLFEEHTDIQSLLLDARLLDWFSVPTDHAVVDLSLCHWNTAEVR